MTLYAVFHFLSGDAELCHTRELTNTGTVEAAPQVRAGNSE